MLHRVPCGSTQRLEIGDTTWEFRPTLRAKTARPESRKAILLVGGKDRGNSFNFGLLLVASIVDRLITVAPAWRKGELAKLLSKSYLRRKRSTQPGSPGPA